MNDRYGHPVGDRVLIEVVARLRRALRRGDIVCRWGGEELAVLAPASPTPAAITAFGERLREVVAAEPLSVSLRLIPVTVSVGGTMLDGSAAPHTAVARADTRSTARSGGATRPSPTSPDRSRGSAKRPARNEARGAPTSPRGPPRPLRTR